MENLRKNENLSIFTIPSEDGAFFKNSIDPERSNLIAASCQKHEVLIISLPDEDFLILKNIVNNNKIGRVVFGFVPLKNGISDIKILLPTHKIFVFNNIYAAYRIDILYDYCLHLFVEHGIPNIFSKTIDYIFPPGRASAL